MHERMKSFFFISLILTVTFLGLSFFMKYSIVNRYDTLINTTYGFIDVNVFEPKNHILSNHAVVMIPGFLEPHKMLYPLGNTIAMMGMRAFVLALPGYSRSTVTFDASFNLWGWRQSEDEFIHNKAIFVYDQVLDELKSRWGIKYFILLGGGIGGAVAVLLNFLRNDIRGTILVHPAELRDSDYELFNDTMPANLLYIYGSFEEDRYADRGIKIMRYAGVSDPKFNDYTYVSDELFKLGGARLLYKAPYTGSLIAYQSFSVMKVVSFWASKITSLPQANVGIEMLRNVLFLIGFATAIISAVLLPSLLSESFGVISGGKRWPKIEIQQKALKILIIWTIALSIVEFLAFLMLVGIYVILWQIKLVVTFHLYPMIILAYSIGIFVISPLFIKSYLQVKTKDILRLMIREILTDPKNVVVGLIEGTYFLLLALYLLDEFFASVQPFLPVLILFIITLPIHFLGALVYEFLFRRIIQEAFGGATPRAALKTAFMSVMLRNIAPIALAIAFAYYGGFLLLSVILLTFLLTIMLAVEFIPANMYYNTREIFPGVIANVMTWYLFVGLITYRIALTGL